MSESMGNRIHDKRTSLNLTMQELGDKVGVQASAVNKWEKGMVENIKASTIKKLAVALDVSPAYLIMGDEPLPQGKYSYVDTSAIADLMLDPANKALVSIINEMTPDEKKELLDYASFLKKKRG